MSQPTPESPTGSVGSDMRTLVCHAVVVIADEIDRQAIERAVGEMDVHPSVVIGVDRAGRGDPVTWVNPKLLASLDLVQPSTQRVMLDLTARRVFVDGAAVSLSRLEYELLVYLAERPGRTVARGELARDVWGFEETSAATITVHIGRLRQKLEHDPRNPVHLLTVRRVGYRFDP